MIFFLNNSLMRNWKIMIVLCTMATYQKVNLISFCMRSSKLLPFYVVNKNNEKRKISILVWKNIQNSFWSKSNLRCSRNSHFIDIPYPKIFKIQLIHLFRQNQSKYSLDEQIVCENTFILIHDILFQQCWPKID